MKPLKVLLISPLAGIDPSCGDITHTQTLLENPPEGVTYETYVQAIEKGTLREHATGRALKRAWRERSRIFREMYFTLANKSLNFWRNRHLFFWEPFRFFSVKPGQYDLIHTHIFAARFSKLDCPLVISAGSPQSNLYRDARHIGPARLALQEFAEKSAARILGVNAYSYHVPQAARLLVYTDYFRDYLIKHRIAAQEKIDILPISLPATSLPTVTRIPNRVGFIAKDFLAKGGPTLIAAWRIVHQQRPDAQLAIIGAAPRPEYAHEPAIEWHPYIPREKLRSEILPALDIFAYPTQCDCISYILLEAMAAGLAIATAIILMPEAVDHGNAGLVSPVKNAPALAANILKLLDAETNHRYRRAAHARFLENYSVESTMPRLRKSYDRALGATSNVASNVPTNAATNVAANVAQPPSAVIDELPSMGSSSMLRVPPEERVPLHLQASTK